ncbi:hypothetical protein P5V15_005897 [Pogonomyrmex californicus]
MSSLSSSSLVLLLSSIFRFLEIAAIGYEPPGDSTTPLSPSPPFVSRGLRTPCGYLLSVIFRIFSRKVSSVVSATDSAVALSALLVTPRIKRWITSLVMPPNSGIWEASQ